MIATPASFAIAKMRGEPPMVCPHCPLSPDSANMPFSAWIWDRMPIQTAARVAAATHQRQWAFTEGRLYLSVARAADIQIATGIQP